MFFFFKFEALGIKANRPDRIGSNIVSAWSETWFP